MIQSDIIDSYMDIKKTANLFINFTLKDLLKFLVIMFLFWFTLFLHYLLIHLMILILFFQIILKLKIFLVFKGSFVSDLFFQSIGLISYLISLTLIITGINIFKIKIFF